MKKRVLFLLILPLLLAAGAEAKPVSVKTTKAYKELRFYVGALGRVEQATSQKKRQYSKALLRRVRSTEGAVQTTADRRERKLERNYQVILQKRYGVSNRRAARRDKTIRSDSARERGKARSLFQKAAANIRASFSRKLRPLGERVSRLEAEKRKARSPRKRALLAEEILLVRRKAATISAKERREIAGARSSYRRVAQTISQKLRRALRASARQRQRERGEVRREWRRDRQAAGLLLADKRREDAALVRKLRARGIRNLDAIIVISSS